MCLIGEEACKGREIVREISPSPGPVLHSFLVRFPYSLPCLVSGLISIVSTVILLLCLPETLGMKKK